MTTEARKAAIRKFKERKPLQGAFAVRCTATGRTWVGASPNLYAVQNRIWWALRHAACREESLQAEWNSHGEPAFQFEILEKLPDDVPALLLSDLLNEKKAHWLARLEAHPI